MSPTCTPTSSHQQHCRLLSYLWIMSHNLYFQGDVAFVHHECLRRWLKTEENKKCSVCNYEYQITQDIMDFDSALKSIHWAMVVPSIVLILFIPYGTYLICRQAEKHDALKKQSTLIKSSAVIICLLIGRFSYDGPISGKLIQLSILKFRGMTQVDFWKTHTK